MFRTSARRSAAASVALAAAITLTALSPGPAVAVDYSAGLHWVSGNDAGDCRSLAVADGVTYLGTPRGLRVLDVDSDGSHEIGSFGHRVFMNIVIDGDIAFANPFFAGGVTILDVSDPTAPDRLARIPGSCCVRLATADGFLYVADGDGLAVHDVRDPAAPAPLSVVLPGETVHDIALAGGFAYLATDEGVSVVDVTDPASPAVLTSLLLEKASRIVLAGNRGYVVVSNSQTSHLTILDLTDPAAPRRLGELTDLGGRKDTLLEWEEGVVVTGGTDEILLLDVAVPGDVRVVGRTFGGGRISAMARRGDDLLVADWKGLQVFDASTLTTVDATVATISTNFEIQSLRRLDDRLLATSRDGHDSLILDVSDAADPRVESTIPSLPEGIVQAGLLYTSTESGAAIFSLANLAAPEQLGFYEVEDHPSLADVAGGVLLLQWYNEASGSWCFDLVDVSDPTSPVRIDRVEALGRPFRAAFVDPVRAFVVGSDSGASNGSLRLFDWSDPGNVRIVQLDTFEESMRFPIYLELVGNRLSVGFILGGASIYDVTDPENAVHLHTLWTPSTAGVLHRRGMFYVSGAAGVHAFDLASADPWPLGTASVGSVGSPGSLMGVGEYVYVVAGGTVHVLAPDDHALPTRTPGAPVPARDLGGGLTLQLGGRNPFRNETTLVLNTVSTAPVDLSVYDLGGRRVRTLLSGVLAAGERRIHWDGRDTEGAGVGGGVYFVRLTVDGESRAARKLAYLGR